jgi:hypothetical protein
MLVDSQDLFYVSFCMLRGGPADPVEFAISLLSFLLFMFEMTLVYEHSNGLSDCFFRAGSGAWNSAHRVQGVAYGFNREL